MMPLSIRALAKDLHMSFGSLKKSMKGGHFLSDLQVQKAVSDVFQSQEEEFYQRGRFNPVKQWGDCPNAPADFARLEFGLDRIYSSGENRVD